jgi:hypothetical protein
LQIYKPVSQCLISFEVSMLIGEQVMHDRLLVKEEMTKHEFLKAT